MLKTATGTDIPVRRASEIHNTSVPFGSTGATLSIIPLLGRLTEISAGANTPWLTTLCRLVLDAQNRNEPAVWVTTGSARAASAAASTASAAASNATGSPSAPATFTRAGASTAPAASNATAASNASAASNATGTPNATTAFTRAGASTAPAASNPTGSPSATTASTRAAASTAPGGIGSETFYPPDLQGNGVDLSLLPVVFVPDNRGAARAAEYLLRSGTFSLVIVELQIPARLPDAVMGRMVSLAAKHGTAVVLVSRSTDIVRHERLAGRWGCAPPSAATGTKSLSGAVSLVSVRLEPRWREIAPYTVVAEVVITKDKRFGPGRRYREVCNGVPGLC